MVRKRHVGRDLSHAARKQATPKKWKKKTYAPPVLVEQYRKPERISRICKTRTTLTPIPRAEIVAQADASEPH